MSLIAGCRMMQKCKVPSSPQNTTAAHSIVRSLGFAASLRGVLDSSLAGLAPAAGVLLPVRHGIACPAVSKEARRRPALACEAGARLYWDRAYRSAKSAPGWVRASTSAVCSSLKSRWTVARSTSPTSARAGVQHSGQCGHPAAGSTALTRSQVACSNSSGTSASPALSSCSLPGQTTLDGSPLTRWVKAVRSSKPSRRWNSRYSPKRGFPRGQVCQRAGAKVAHDRSAAA